MPSAHPASGARQLPPARGAAHRPRTRRARARRAGQGPSPPWRQGPAGGGGWDREAWAQHAKNRA
ncbi:MAG: hypothetical protein FJX19_00940 [Alphaproteobacteria bacterium]|nr:hypothetical protein [Alphaproteobacteria bacterium]